MSTKGTSKAAPKDSPTSDVEEETETEYSSADEGDARESATFGSMRTRLRWDAELKALNLDVRQYVQSRRKLELKYKGRLNTHSGEYAYTAQVQRIMSQNTPSLARIMAAEQGIPLEGEDDIDPRRFLPAGLQSLLFKDWTMAPGLRLATAGTAAAALAPAAGSDGSTSTSTSSSKAFRYCVTFRKQPQVLWRRGVWDSWLEGKLDLELAGGQQGKQQQQEDQDQDDAGSGGGGGGVVGVRGALRLKVLRLNVTQQQDVQLSVGVDYARSHSSSNSRGGRTAGDSSSGSLTPYVKLSENSWAVRLSRGALAFTYDI